MFLSLFKMYDPPDDPSFSHYTQSYKQSVKWRFVIHTAFVSWWSWDWSERPLPHSVFIPPPCHFECQQSSSEGASDTQKSLYSFLWNCVKTNWRGRVLRKFLKSGLFPEWCPSLEQHIVKEVKEAPGDAFSLDTFNILAMGEHSCHRQVVRRVFIPCTTSFSNCF